MARPPKSADFFRAWTPEMAYVLGYWWADGSMRVKKHGAYEIEISSNDRNHLKQLASVIGGKIQLRKVSHTSQCYKIIFCSSGSPLFLEGFITAIAEQAGIPAPKLQANRNNWTIKWSTIRAKCLAGWLYYDNPGLALPRKQRIAAHFLDWQPKKKPEQGTITERMRLNFPAYLPK